MKKVQLFNGEQINDYKVVVTTTDIKSYSIANDRYQVVFYTEAGEGRNYFEVVSVYDKKNKRTYNGQRYHIKFIPIVREFSGMLFLRFKDNN